MPSPGRPMFARAVGAKACFNLQECPLQTHDQIEMSG